MGSSPFMRTGIKNMDKSVKVGFFSTFIIVGALISVRFLCGGGFSKVNSYNIVLDCNKGVSKGSKVFLNGFLVGRVSNVEFLYDTLKTKVYFDIDGKIFLKNSSVVLVNEGIISDTWLDVKIGDGNVIDTNTTVKSNIHGNSLNNIFAKINAIVDQLSNACKALDGISDVVNLNISKLNSVIESVNNICCNVGSLTSDFKRDYKDLSKTFSSVKDTLLKVNTLVKNTDEGVRTVVNSMKKENIIDNISEAIKELNVILKKVDAIADDFKSKPGRYLKFF